MPDRKAEPGVWGSCKCGTWRFLPTEGKEIGGPYLEHTHYWRRPSDGSLRTGPFYCSDENCGDFCGEGGEIRPNLWREVLSGDKHICLMIVLGPLGWDSAWPPRYYGAYCAWEELQPVIREMTRGEGTALVWRLIDYDCGEQTAIAIEQHPEQVAEDISAGLTALREEPNLRRVAEEMLAEALGTQAQAQAQQKLGSINYHDWMQAAAIERVLRRLFARVANCPTCGASGYVEGKPCADCHPDAREAEDGIS